MELMNVEAKFNLTTNIVLKNDIVKKAKKSNLDIDEVLDDYICDKSNLENIYDLIEESLNSDLEIESIDFIENQTLIDTYSDSDLYITCECIINTEKLYNLNKSIFTIEYELKNASFWLDKENMIIKDCKLSSVIA